MYKPNLASSPDTFLFTDAACEPLHPDRVTKLFEKKQTAIRTAQKKADPKPPTLPRPASRLRHAYASMGVDAGVHPKVTDERLGHDVMTYMKVYVTTYAGISETVAELIAASVDAD